MFWGRRSLSVTQGPVCPVVGSADTTIFARHSARRTAQLALGVVMRAFRLRQWQVTISSRRQESQFSQPSAVATRALLSVQQ